MVLAHECHSPVQTVSSEHSFLIYDDFVRRCIAHDETIFINMVDDALHAPGIQGVSTGNIQ